MKILLRSPSQPGAPATERVIDASVIRIGRGAEQDLVMADLRVALAHAELSLHKSFLTTVVRVEAKTRLGVWLNGNPVSSSDLKPGDTLDFGRYRLSISKGRSGCDLTLSLSEFYAQHEERDSRIAALKTTLADTGWSRRRLAWLLFWLVLLPALALPVALHLRTPNSAAAATRSLVPQASPAPDIAWNSGPLSKAHHALSNDCGACHRKPFEAVRDESCRGCHDTLKEHVGTAETLKHPPFAGQRCTDCHREHNGEHLIPTGNTACTSCHSQPLGTPTRPVKAVLNWSTQHPAFVLKLSRKDGDGFKWIEARQGTPEAERQDTGLKFPHDVHLRAKGVDAPGGVRVMKCADCHQASDDAISFKPVQMVPHCAECHRLDFDPAAPNRELPHGKPAEVVQVVRDYYARVALTGGVADRNAPAVVQNRRRPGDTLPTAQGRMALVWADARANVALRDVFERRTCFYCHVVTKTDSPTAPWKIAPVAPTQAALTAAVFPHGRHQSETCQSCHASETSKHAEQVLLPGIKRCRDCHGDTGAFKETPSTCQSCHGYHRAVLPTTKAQALPTGHPRSTPPTAIAPKAAP